MPSPDFSGVAPPRVGLDQLADVRFKAAPRRQNRALNDAIGSLSPTCMSLALSAPVMTATRLPDAGISVTSNAPKAPAAARTGAQDIDLSGVDPRRWPEIRRRIEAIQSYIALGRRDGAARDRYAAQLGLSPMTFLALVQAWKAHGAAIKLSGAGIDRRKPRPRRSLPDATCNAIRDAIAALGTSARHSDVVAEAHRRCDEIGTRRASDGMVQRLLMKARRDTPVTEGAPAILIGRVVCKLPVKNGEEVVFPDLVLAVMSPEGTIAAHALVPGEDTAAPLRRVLAELNGQRTPGAPPRDVVMPAALSELATDAGGIPTVLGPTVPTVLGLTVSRISHLLGSGIEQVDIAHRRKATTGPAKGDNRMNMPLTPDEAAAAIRLAVDLHNESRGGLALFDIAEATLDTSLAA